MQVAILVMVPALVLLLSGCTWRGFLYKGEQQELRQFRNQVIQQLAELENLSFGGLISMDGFGLPGMGVRYDLDYAGDTLRLKLHGPLGGSLGEAVWSDTLVASGILTGPVSSLGKFVSNGDVAVSHNDLLALFWGLPFYRQIDFVETKGDTAFFSSSGGFTTKVICDTPPLFQDVILGHESGAGEKVFSYYWGGNDAGFIYPLRLVYYDEATTTRVTVTIKKLKVNGEDIRNYSRI